MKNIYIILSVLILTSCFGQKNLVLQQQKKKTTSGGITPPPVVENQQEEKDYFAAYYLPVSQKANIQTALDTYGSVRLGPGDYKGVNLRLTSNMKLYGHPTLKSVISQVTIANGSSGIIMDHLFPTDVNIIMEAGNEIHDNTFKSIKWAVLVAGAGAKIANNKFINFGGPIRFDVSSSGYIRNNTFVKHQTGTVSNLLVMKGNNTTPSYGNVHIHTNFLTPHGDTSNLDTMQSMTFVGIDGEGWNLNGEGTRPMIDIKNSGNVKIADLGGDNGYSSVITGVYDIAANNTLFINKLARTNLDKLSLNNNIIQLGVLGTYTRYTGTTTGFDLTGNNNDDYTFKYNGVEQTSTISNSTIVDELRTAILGTQYTPYPKPTFETPPDINGATWKTDRVGKTDSQSYIQGLINTNNVADLPAGTYYIGSTLTIPLDNNHGIIGAGTGKTSIVALTDTFPLITLTGGQDANFTLANITLQGGTKAVYSSQNFGTQHMSFVWLKYIVFRDQTVAAIHLDKMRGFDNNFFDHLSFINCAKGFWQESASNGSSDPDVSSFVDKTVFYGCQFLNCDTSVSMLATRADNLNAWVDCKFAGGLTALDLSNQNFPMTVNSTFSGFTGEQIARSNTLSFYHTNFSGNFTTNSTLKAVNISLEGCNFSDSVKPFASVQYNPVQVHIMNSTVAGNVTTLGADSGWTSPLQLMSVNNTLTSNSSISKLLSYVKNNNAVVLINETPTPYPQLLVKQ